MVQGHLSMVFVWFLSLEEAVASLRLNLIHEPGEPIGEHSLNVGVQIISGTFCLELSVWQAVAKQTQGFSGSATSHFL